MTSWFALLAALSCLSLPSSSYAQTICDQYVAISQEPYTLCADLWGSSDGVGGQCATIGSVNDNIVTWSTNYSWTDSYSIMSFAHIQYDKGIHQRLSAISSMHSTWTWDQSSEEVVADVAYDIFTSYIPGGDNAVEVMVWLADYNAGPISYDYDASGNPIPIAKNLHINDHYWDLYLGTNYYNTVYSFLPIDGNINNWSGDMFAFFKYLIEKQHVDSSQYLKTVQAGTEVTSGTAVFETTAYSLSIN